MKIKLYGVLISVLLLVSFSGFAAVKADKSVFSTNKSVAVKRSAAFFSMKSSVYKKDGLVKRKGSRKSCPAFEL